MVNRIFKILLEWEDKVELRNSYTYGDEEVVLTDFTELFEDTYEIIKTVKNEFMRKNIILDSCAHFSYLRLLTTLSKYMIYDNAEDESENRAFSASCLIAQKLVEYASWETMDDEEEKGIFSFNRHHYPYYSDIPEGSENLLYKYDIHKADFTEILELAATL